MAIRSEEHSVDGQQFDAITRSLAAAPSRRRLLTSFGAGLATLVLGGRMTHAQRAKAPLCHATGDPANPYVVIEVAEPAWDTHFAHGDMPYVDCCLDTDCAAGQVCANGTCTAQCPESARYCPSDGQCYFVNCGSRASWDETACRCECDDAYVSLPEGKCGVPCTSDADCSAVGGTCTASNAGAGPNVCAAGGYLVSCSPPQAPACTSNEGCADPCDGTVCRADGTCTSQT